MTIPANCATIVRDTLWQQHVFVYSGCLKQRVTRVLSTAPRRRLEEVLLLKQSRLLALIREGNRQQAAAASTAGSAGAAAVHKQAAPARGLKRSESVAWSSRTLHVSSDGFSEAAEVAAAAAEAAAAAARVRGRAVKQQYKW
jgi:hypothetical protein